MSETRQGRRSDPAYSTVDRQQTTGWVGFVVFAGIMLMMLGSLHVIEGFVALVKDEYYLVGSSGLVLSMDFTAWGWTHLIIGILAVGAGVGVLAGQTWARVFGIAIAVLSALANVLFVSAYPIWSIIVIALDVLVIYALAVHGREVRY
jgi:hypothetical protein